MAAIDGKRVAIVGGGLGGLVSAIALLSFAKRRQLRVHVEVFERDASPAVRAYQGYSISIRGQGLDALEALGLYAQVEASAAPSTMFFLRDSRMQPLLEMPHTMGGRGLGMRVPRTGLRSVLLDALPEEITLHWAAHAVDAISTRNSEGEPQVRLQFEDGSESANFDLLVVADGANSKLRRSLLPHEILSNSGAKGLIARCRMADVIAPFQNCHGMILGERCFIFLSPVTAEEQLWAICVTSDTPTPAFLPDDPEFDLKPLLKWALEQTKEIPQPMPSMIAASILPTMRLGEFQYKLPNPSLPDLAVTFVGDACHPMTPFSGNGANVAMADGYKLADQLTSNKTIAEALKKYDAEMIPRAASFLKRGLFSQELLITQSSSLWKRTVIRMAVIAGNIIKHRYSFLISTAICVPSLIYVWRRRTSIATYIVTRAVWYAIFGSPATE